MRLSFLRPSPLRALACVLCMFTSACATGPQRPDASDYPRVESHAISPEMPSALRTALGPQAAAHPGLSGFKLLPKGDESLRMRLAMVMAAEKSIDLQYYAMHDDSAANLMLEALMLAGERGVHVRFLLDSISLRDVEHSLAMLESNPNIEVRVFNPVVTKDQGLFSKINSVVVNFDKALRRMHNKAIMADNQLAIVGGRNIGDEYFDARPDTNFADMDLLTAGPITARISASFDKYWNSDDAFPLRALKTPDQREMTELRQAMQQAWQREMANGDNNGPLSYRMAEKLTAGDVGFIWAPAELTADDPSKINVPAPDIADSRPASKLEQLLSGAQRSFVAVSPYFVPGELGVSLLRDMRARGIDVTILTNSLASTDVVAVHTGYKKYREDVLRTGASLYEFKPQGKRPRQRLLGSSAPPKASLHSKMFVIDRRDVVIGSYNLDPRSTELNTEIAVVIHSPELAAQVLHIVDRSVAPRHSFRVELTPDGLQWVTQERDALVRYTHEPKAGAFRQVQSALFSLLPIEDQL